MSHWGVNGRAWFIATCINNNNNNNNNNKELVWFEFILIYFLLLFLGILICAKKE